MIHKTPITLFTGAVLAAAVSAGLPAAASASTVSLEGDVLVVRAAPGETNWLTVGPSEDEPGKLQIGDNSLPEADPSLCTTPEWSYSFITCVAPPGGVRLEAGDGQDIIDVHDKLPASVHVVGDGGAGNDTLRGASFTETTDELLGGAGNDKVYGGLGADAIDGGPGDDEVEGRGGPDAVRGGDGNDKLLADYWEEMSTDVVDGGPGYDQIEMNWQSGGSSTYQPPIDVSVDGVANDGRPGENDDVTGIERIYLTAAATLTGSDGNDELTVFNTDGTGSKLVGRGGDDQLSGFDLDDVIDGGAGADAIEGGYGNDTIVGGPGRDVINGDVSGTSCHWIQCRMPYGNDTIDARDGEADQVTCGIGEDSVKADAADTVAPDCETVDKGGAAPTGPTGPGGDQQSQGGPTTTAGKPVVISSVRARRRGARITVTGRATGAAKVTVTATRAGRRVARASARVRGGRFTARLRTRAKRLKVTVAAGATKAALTVR